MSSLSGSESDEEDDIDRRVEYLSAPTRLRTAAAPTALQLPAVQVRAERRLRNRRRNVAVEEAYDAAEGRPSTAVEHVGRVAGLLTHTVCHFPECGLL